MRKKSLRRWHACLGLLLGLAASSSAWAAGPAQAGVVTGKTAVTATIRVQGDPVPWAPVTFALDGLGSLEIHQTQTGSLGRAVTVFVPPIGQSGTASITATANIDGDTITDTVTLNFEGRAYYSIAELHRPPRRASVGSPSPRWTGLNNHGVALVATPQGPTGTAIVRVGAAPVPISGMLGFDIADDGAVFGGTNYYDVDTECENRSEAAVYRSGAVQHFPGIFGLVECFYGSFFLGNNSSGSRVAGISTYPYKPWYAAPDSDFRLTYNLATLWVDGAPVLLNPAGAVWSEADDVNDAGVAVGYAQYSSEFTFFRQGCIWGPGGGFSAIGYEAFPRKVNNHGEAIGAQGNQFAYLWLPAPAYGLPAGAHKLPSLPAGGGHARDINDVGQVVGHILAEGADIATRRGWLWMNGVTHDLNDLIAPDSLYKILRAYAINASGQILCEAMINNDPLDYVYVLLTPEG